MKIDYSRPKNRDKAQIFSLLESLNGDRSNFDISHFLIGKHGDKIITCVRLKVISDDILELASLAVLPKYQGQGIGSELLKKLLIIEKTRPVFLLTTSDKENFYKKFNFSLIKQELLPGPFKDEYFRIVNLPFTKNIKVIAMVLN